MLVSVLGISTILCKVRDQREPHATMHKASFKKIEAVLCFVVYILVLPNKVATKAIAEQHINRLAILFRTSMSFIGFSCFFLFISIYSR
jgi:hypothetical protein